MQNAGKTIEEANLKQALNKAEGLGTDATRAGILKAIEASGYVTLKGKSYEATPKAEVLLRVVSPQITSAHITASWESRLAEIATMAPEQAAQASSAFIEDLKNELGGICASAESHVIAELVQHEEVIGRCPVCGSDVIAYSKSFVCEKHHWNKETEQASGCPFQVFRVIAGKTLTVIQATELLRTGRLGKLSGFKKKDGGAFSAALALDKATGKVDFVFNQANKPKRRGWH
jgi:DNA topoisomerase-3